MKILRDPLFLLLACLLLGWAVYQGIHPPRPLSKDAPANLFSAARAVDVLEELYPENRVHVAGSPANAALAQRIIERFRALDFEVETQRRFHCKAQFGRCSPVENIVAFRPGVNSGTAVLLTAHYDSSWSGPGVGDDGAAVAAILEIARLVNTQPPFSNDLIFLVTDGEEQGLIGADAFAQQHDLFKRVRAVINLDARGSSGASTMFETGEGNRGIIRMLAKNLDRPVANSLSYEVYRRMPNDTDFTVYRGFGLPGVNFAFTGGAAAYHSRIDDLEHLDKGSLQHHGDNAWSMLLALDERNLDRLRSDEDAAFIDLFGRSLLHYPASSAMGLALVLSVLVMIGIRRSYHRRVMVRQVLRTLVAVVLLAVLLPVSGWVLSWPLGRWVDMNPLQHPYPWIGRSALLLASLLVVTRVARLLAAGASTGSVMTGSWGVFSLMSLGLAYAMPVASYVAVLPLLGFIIGLIFDGFRWKEEPRLAFASLFGFLATVYVGLYFFFQLDVVANFELSAIMVVPLLLPAVAALPLLVPLYEGPRRGNGFSLVLLLAVAAACVGQHFVPTYTPDVPRDMNLMVRQDSGRDEALLVLESGLGRPDPQFAEQQGFVPVELPEFDGVQKSALARTTPLLELPQIRFEQRELDPPDEGAAGYRVELKLLLPEELRLLALSFPSGAGLLVAKVDGQVAYDSKLVTRHSSSGPSLVINHPPKNRMTVELDFERKQAVEIQVTGRFDFPPGLGAPMAADWPVTAQAAFLGPRALTVERISVGQ